MANSALFEQLYKQWSATLIGNFSLGLSGGVDSVVLFYLLKQYSQLNLNFKFTAIHVNHGISTASDQWEQFVITLCQTYNIELEIFQHQLKKSQGSLELIARNMRYQSFRQSKNQNIILAHHQDDQIESTYSQIMRASDIHNLAGMKSIAHLRGKIFYRPLLVVPKSEILNYAQIHQLKHIEDDSNHNKKFLRNFLRLQIIPQLQQFDANFKFKAVKLNRKIQEYCVLIDEFSLVDFNNCHNKNNKLYFQNLSLEQKLFIQLSPSRQLNLLNFFIRHQSALLSKENQLKEFITQVIKADHHNLPQLKLSANQVLVCYSGQIYIEYLLPNWQYHTDLLGSNYQLLETEIELVKLKRLSIKLNNGQTAKEFFQTTHISPLLRKNFPFVRYLQQLRIANIILLKTAQHEPNNQSRNN